MKRHIRFLALLAALCLLLALGASAEGEESGLWSEEYYRVLDSADALSDAEVESLDEECIKIVSTYHVDLALLTVTSEKQEEDSLEDWAREAYEYCSFGYGGGKDGFMAAYNTDTEELVLLCFGNAASRVDPDYREFILSSAPGYRAEHGVFGVLYAVIRHTANYLEQHPEAVPGNGRGGTAGKPVWYPDDPADFEKYHDPDAPRVVDTANIFTAAEKSAMEKRLGEVRAELGKDIVVFTDVSSYGLGHAVYSADFYDFNGYGIGDEYEGVCLFICMDPEDRGFWTCCTGPETRGLFTEEYANQLDDRLYEYMKAGDYGEGAADWIENFRQLYRTGMPFPPEWYPADGFTRTHDASAPRVVDELGLLSPTEKDALAAQAKAISDKYGIDVLILTAKNASSLYSWEYDELYYACFGYGFGEDYDGVMLSVQEDRYGLQSFDLTAFGAQRDKLTYLYKSRIGDKTGAKFRSQGAYAALRQGLKDIAHLEKTGRVARTWSYWAWIAVLGAAVSAVFGGICLSAAKSKMAVPAVRESAGIYLDRNSVRIDRVTDDLVNTTTSRKYSPVERSSGGGGGSSGGGSSYSSSYSGSSGTSHSGSGRSF